MQITTEILAASVEFIDRRLSHPLQLSTGMITEITEARATVRVRANGQEATGVGAIYLSDLWAWPDASLSHEVRDGVMRGICVGVAKKLGELCGEAGHPLVLGLRLHEAVCHGSLAALPVPTTVPATVPTPLLAQALCASPFDAAIHDATGRALGISAFDFYAEDLPVELADRYFARGSTFAAIRAALCPQRESLTGWWLVGAKDALPGCLEEPVARRGYTAFKLKVLAASVEEDVARTIAVYDAAKAVGAKAPRISIDSNEGNKSPAEVLEYLTMLKAQRPDVFAAFEYLEQPTSRDIEGQPHDWRAVAALKPVMLDEGLTDLSLLPLAQEQGWGGLALKTCKGHSFTLVAAAWAKERGLPVAMQDLTNPGYAAIHSYLTAAHLNTINGVELNSPQYTPAANEEWLPRLSGLFELKDGQHRLPVAKFVGLGSEM